MWFKRYMVWGFIGIYSFFRLWIFFLIDEYIGFLKGINSKDEDLFVVKVLIVIRGKVFFF